MLRVGLTGGIGAGKSTVSSELAELGAVIVDADLIAREVVEPGTEGLAALVDRFGGSILTADGRLDRPALAAVAFADDESRTALNAVLHPLIGRRTAERIEQAPPDAVVVQDIPLLVEGGMGPAFPLVAIVFVEEPERLRRLTEIRGMDEKDARARIAAQASDEQRVAVADVRLDNNGEPEDLVRQVRQLWHERLVPFEANLRSRTPVSVLPRLAEPDPEWPAEAGRLAARLRLLCGADAIRVDHIGSTAVPGLASVDVVDVQVTVADLASADRLVDHLADGGYPRVAQVYSERPKPAYVGGEVDPAVWEMRLHGAADPGRPAHVHLRVDGSPGQQFALLFRDWLRADPDVRAEYLRIKEASAERAADAPTAAETRARYADGKAPWFDRAYHRAWAWAEETGWTVSAS
ncbi:dephospho-CoA kinase [Rhodococcus triatomae]|uniref:Dephospho-CoA kinase n=1 Tax=Rhodococcus triatomae TaxID=300028 RepID=A0A1G8CL43_9NOCA|nr:dephospho-CoA kinase [Rhodococcus triatomae]QNG18625.1 dephospho-CoA kinase [Rhodococcus triatomae]QNG21705.1 dephospho-CoA kinase [Rhodococcus triatomae]SDH46251.1 dephospho-CoA kinase [Rhodococcus triatomae]